MNALSGGLLPRKVERDKTAVGPEIQIARNELSALIHPYGLRVSEEMTYPSEHLDDIGTAEANRGPIAGENREKVSTIVSRRSLRPRGKLVMDKVHRPNLVRVHRGLAILTKLGPDPRLGTLLRNCRPISRYNR
jgi:hypothetical protein